MFFFVQYEDNVIFLAQVRILVEEDLFESLEICAEIYRDFLFLAQVNMSKYYWLQEEEKPINVTSEKKKE